MNNTVLSKCIEELGKETPRLDYIRGMLETLVAMTTPVSPVNVKVSALLPVNLPTSDEHALLDAKTKAGLTRIQPFETITGPGNV